MIRHIRALAAVAALSLSSVACMAPIDEEEIEVEETTQDLVSRSARFETFQGIDGRHYFHLIAGNGENVLRSQGYTALASAQKGVASVLANGNDKRNFDVREAKNGQYYFNLKAANGQIIGTSELYVSKGNAERGARTVRALVRLVGEATSEAAPRRERFELYTGEDKLTYFRLRAANGESLLGSQGYTAKASAKKGIASVQTNGSDVSRFDVFEAFDGGWVVNLVAANGEVVAQSEAYSSKSNANRAVKRIAEILESRLTVTER
ncbi:MAG: DUF1508 domain-containing protein [Labilithrix sp.]|nr:DUF1508 domain-containing protein [Labilithrix sp.]MCW5833976.1 DUF1508 domain-containing protein [Labilithrix sp.]